MRIKKGILGLLALAGVISLASCGGEKAPNTNPTTPTATDPFGPEPEETTGTEVVPTFETYTLEMLHEARKAQTLENLHKKTVCIKGKVTYAKRADNTDSMFIQSGKYALEVSYPDTYTVNVGDSVEVKGAFSAYKISEICNIKLYVDHSMNSHYDVKVINEAINVEEVTINSMADLIEYDSSKAVMDFTVVANRSNAAFVGKLPQGNDQIIVAPKGSLAEKFDEPPYVENDRVRYSGIFTFSGSASARVLRYFDKAGFTKLN